MDFSFWNQSFVEKFIQSICLTLVHSLWQGLIVAILAGMLLIFTRKSRPALRYNLLSVLLFGFVLMSGITFWLVMTNGAGARVSDLAVNPMHAAQSIALKSGQNTAFSSGWGQTGVKRIVSFCSENASVIVALWLIIFTLKSLSAASGLIYLRKIKTKNIAEVDEKWKNRLRMLCKSLGISQQVRLLESPRVKVPMVAGYWKPVILLPIGMLCNLSASQVEAILLHELAHIKRRDYLVNLLQISCENVFFFNPALLWLSGLIREEREHCCDDLAISVMRDSQSFVQALVSFQEYNLKENAMGLAFSRKRNHLLDRIKRIIYQNNKQLNAMEKLFVTLSLVAVTVCSAAMKKTETHWKPKSLPFVKEAGMKAKPEIEPVIYRTDTLPKKKTAVKSEPVIHSANMYSPTEGVSSYNVDFNGKRYEIVKKNGKIISLEVDGVEISADQYGKYSADVAQIDQKVKAAHEQAEKERAKAEVLRAEADGHRKEAEKHRQEAEVRRAEADKQRQQAAAVRLEAEQHRKNADQMRVQAEAMREQAEKMRGEAEQMRALADKARSEAEVVREKAEKMRLEFEKRESGLIEELLKLGVIKDTKGLSYLLSDDELIVNGAKQPADLQKKLAAKYLEQENAEMVYNYKGRTGYTFTGLIHSK